MISAFRRFTELGFNFIKYQGSDDINCQFVPFYDAIYLYLLSQFLRKYFF